MNKTNLSTYLIIIFVVSFFLFFLIFAISKTEALSERFVWEYNHQLENKSRRTHTTKDFQHPTDQNKRIKIQSSGLLHYFDTEFKDLFNLPFPEGEEITTTTNRYFVMDLPEWGRESLNEDKKILRIFDKKNVSIYLFKNPFAVSKGVKPYKIVTKTGEFIKDTFDKTERKNIDERVEIKTEVIDELQFEVENHKLYLKIPELKNSTYPIQIYDDIDTGSTNNKDAFINTNASSTNYGANTTLVTRTRIADTYIIRTVMDWSLFSGSGIISSIRLYLYSSQCFGAPVNCNLLDVHELTQTFVENEVSWIKYSAGNFWAVAGGDYAGAVVDSKEWTPPAWDFFDLGSGATNPISGLTWGSNVDLLIKENNETVADTGTEFYSKENADVKKPYIEITYTEIPPISTSSEAILNNIFFGFWFLLGEYFIAIWGMVFFITIFLAIFWFIIKR